MTHVDYQTESKNNEHAFNQLLASVNPGLWRVYQALEETKINPEIIRAFVYALYEVSFNTGHGKVITHVEKGQVTNMDPIPTMSIDLPAIMTETVVLKYTK